MKQMSDEAVSIKIVPITRSTLLKQHSNSWGWLPLLSVISAFGICLVALAYEGGRIAASWAFPLFWCGLLTLFLPIMIRLLSPHAVRRERITLLMILAMLLYLVKYLEYPLYFAGYDEFLHWRTALDIATSGHLFHENPLLPISAYYPGLEIVVNAVSSLTGLSIFVSGTFLIGVAQVVFVLSLYLLFEALSSSAQVAGIATALYMANADFLFFDTEFAYESFALPLAIFVLYVLVRRYKEANNSPGTHKSMTLIACLGLVAVVVTHHLTSYALVIFLFFWLIISLVRYAMTFSRHTHLSRGSIGPGAIALSGLLLCVAWLMYTGDVAVGYLVPHIDSMSSQIMQIVAGTHAPRQLFHNTSGFVVPLWERVLSYASVALILIGLPLGLFRIWQQYRTHAGVLAIAGVAIAYPVTQVLRLIPAGAEIGNRATEFVFPGIAFVLAVGAMHFWFARTPQWRGRMMMMGLTGIMCVGQFVLGSGQPWSLLPGPYLVSADARSIEPEGIMAAKWANAYLGSGHIIGGDRVNTLLMATYGNERAVMSGSTRIPVSWVFTAPAFGPGVVTIIMQDKIQYIVVDQRLSTSLPYVGTYFNQSSSGGQPITEPIDPTALSKFASVPDVSRIFDSGNIIIYDVHAVTPASSAFSVTPTPTHSCKSSLPSSSASVPSSSADLAKQYSGTFFDVVTGVRENMYLTGIQQRRGYVCGYVNGITAKGIFSGSISADHRVQFVLSHNAGQLTVIFDGELLPDGTISGTYCIPGTGTGTCSDYGLWSISPAQ